jgi:hypothetical protein
MSKSDQHPIELEAKKTSMLPFFALALQDHIAYKRRVEYVKDMFDRYEAATFLAESRLTEINDLRAAHAEEVERLKGERDEARAVALRMVFHWPRSSEDRRFSECRFCDSLNATEYGHNSGCPVLSVASWPKEDPNA